MSLIFMTSMCLNGFSSIPKSLLLQLQREADDYSISRIGCSPYYINPNPLSCDLCKLLLILIQHLVEQKRSVSAKAFICSEGWYLNLIEQAIFGLQCVQLGLTIHPLFSSLTSSKLQTSTPAPLRSQRVIQLDSRINNPIEVHCHVYDLLRGSVESHSASKLYEGVIFFVIGCPAFIPFSVKSGHID